MTNKLYGIMPALMTAFDDRGIDKVKVTALVQKLENDGVHGLYVGGSSGEMIFCSAEERKELLQAVKEAADKLAIIAHVGAMTTADSVKLAKHAKSVKADAVSSVTPLYYKYSFEEIKTYYKRIADAAKLPVIIYNIPVLTGTVLNLEQLCELLEIDGVEGMKFTSSDFYLLNRLKNLYPQKVFYNGSDEMLLSGLSAGADGGIGTTYNFIPKIILEIYNNFKSGNFAGAYECQTLANRVISSVLKHGVLPASKHMISLTGIDYGVCREPVLPLCDKAKNDLFENAYKLICDFEKKCR